jgi:hypothetical protein
MPKRTAKFVSGVVAGILAGIPLATTLRGETVAPDNCLSAPKGETPQGSHWHYRIEHGTKRQCWYLRQEGERLSQASPHNILPPVKPAAPVAPPPNPAPVQHPPVDARAELPQQLNQDNMPAAAPPAATVRANDSARADGSAVNASSAVLATRWPEPNAIQPANPQAVQSNQTTSTLTDSTTTPVAADTVAPAPVDAAVIPADADSSSSGQRGFMPLLVALLGALTLAVAIVVSFGRPRRRLPRTIRVQSQRAPIWETTDDDRIVLSDYPVSGANMRRSRFARSFGETDERKPEAYPRKTRQARA